MAKYRVHILRRGKSISYRDFKTKTNAKQYQRFNRENDRKTRIVKIKG